MANRYSPYNTGNGVSPIFIRFSKSPRQNRSPYESSIVYFGAPSPSNRSLPRPTSSSPRRASPYSPTQTSHFFPAPGRLSLQCLPGSLPSREASPVRVRRLPPTSPSVMYPVIVSDGKSGRGVRTIYIDGPEATESLSPKSGGIVKEFESTHKGFINCFTVFNETQRPISGTRRPLLHQLETLGLDTDTSPPNFNAGAYANLIQSIERVATTLCHGHGANTQPLFTQAYYLQKVEKIEYALVRLQKIFDDHSTELFPLIEGSDRKMHAFDKFYEQTRVITLLNHIRAFKAGAFTTYTRPRDQHQNIPLNSDERNMILHLAMRYMGDSPQPTRQASGSPRCA